MSLENTNLCVEAICQCGCEAVRAVITALEAGEPVSQVQGLEPHEQRRVLDELKAVMAVYDDR